MGRAIPRSDADFVNWALNFAAKAPTVLNPLGFVAADYAAMNDDCSMVGSAVNEQVARQTAAQSATQAKNLAREEAQKRFQARSQRIKSHPLYTPAIGEQLGIVAPESAGPAGQASQAASTLRPALRGLISGDGVATIKFIKNGYTGIVIYCRRGGEREFALLAKQFGSPLVDNRPNLMAGMPEIREYKAQFLRGDAPVGQMSDVLVLTVPVTPQAGRAADRTELTSAPGLREAA